MVTTQYINYVAATLLTVVAPVLFVLGTIGNLLSVIVLTRPGTRRQSTAVYLTALSISDLLSLWVGLPRLWVRGLLQVDIRTLSTAMCKVHAYLTYVTTQCSSWLIVAVTLERVFMVLYPLRVRIGCTVRSAGQFIFGIVLFIATLNSHLLFMFRIVSDPSNGTICGPEEELGEFYYTVWPVIDLVILFLIPFVILAVGNIVIITKVRQSQVFQTTSGAPVSATSTPNSGPVVFLTAMLITLNVVFLLLVSPVAAFMVSQCGLLPDDSVVNKEREIAVCNLIWDIVNLLVYVNYSVNFILYMMCGGRFRSEVNRLLCYWRRPTITSGHHVTTNMELSAGTTNHGGDTVR